MVPPLVTIAAAAEFQKELPGCNPIGKDLGLATSPGRQPINSSLLVGPGVGRIGVTETSPYLTATCLAKVAEREGLTRKRCSTAVSEQPRGASCDKLPPLASEHLGVGRLNHAHARSAILCQDIQRNSCLNCARNI